MPIIIPLIPVVASAVLRTAVKAFGKQAIKKGVKSATKPKPFRPARARSASEQDAYLKTLQATKELRFAKNAIKRTKKKIGESKDILKANKKKEKFKLTGHEKFAIGSSAAAGARAIVENKKK